MKSICSECTEDILQDILRETDIQKNLLDNAIENKSNFQKYIATIPAQSNEKYNDINILNVIFA